jgi:integrase
MAYISKLPSGKWRAEVSKNGKRTSASFKTKAEATNWAAAEEAAIVALKRGVFPRKTLGEAMDRYVDEVSPAKRGERHEGLRLRAFQRDFPALAGMVLHEIKTPDMAGWRDARLRKVSPGSVARDINLLSNLFTVAREEWHWCGPSPLTGMRRPKDNPPRTRRVKWQEVKAICRWLGYRTGDVRTKQQQVALAFLLGLRTGMRAGEILSLSPANVDLERRVATVVHKTQHLTGRPRDVPLTRQAVRLLRGHQGFTLTSASLDALFRKARDARMLKDLHFHDSRAEALTRLARKVDVLTLSRISGHKDINLLSSVYYRETAEDVAARLDHASKPSRPTPSTS